MPKRRSCLPDRLYKKIFCRTNFMNNDLPFYYTDAWEIQVEKVNLKSADQVARYSFVAHKSVTCLDLSVGEYGKREKLCYTEEAFKNNVLDRRYILYKYHLDVTRRLDDKISVLKLNESICKPCSLSESFFVQEVSVVDQYVYNIDIKSYVVTAVRKSNQKVRTLMKFIRLLQNPNDFPCYFYDFLKLIIEEREDSALVCTFLFIQPRFLKEFFFTRFRPQFVEFALYHITRERCRVFQGQISWKPVLFYGSDQCFYILIKYGYNFPFFPQEEYVLTIRHAVEYFLQSDPHLHRSWDFFSSERRRNIFAQTLFFYRDYYTKRIIQSIDLILQFWQSIPDPFFTYDELSQACNSLRFGRQQRMRFIQMYASKVNFARPPPELKPRSLFHLSRCKIREHMSSLFQLPHGIKKLMIPEKLKAYLFLEVPHQI